MPQNIDKRIFGKKFCTYERAVVGRIGTFYDCIYNKKIPETNIQNSLNVLKVCKQIVNSIGE